MRQPTLGRALLLAALLSGGLVSPARAEVRVVAGIEPVAWVVRQVGGDAIEVKTLLPSATAPETFEPGARHLVDLAGSDHLFIVGLPFERRFVGRMKGNEGLPPLTDLSVGLETGGDPHVWLDPRNLASMAPVVTEGLVALIPAEETVLRARAAAFVRDLEELDAELGAELGAYRGRTLLTVHPAYGAFARRYGLRQVALEREGHAPTARHLAELMKELRDTSPTFILTQPQHSDRAARVLQRELDLRRVQIDPLTADVTTVLRRLARLVVTGVEEARP